MRIQILVNQYRENEEIISFLLQSIAIQQNICFNNIEVIIINDGSDVILSEKFLKQYNYSIKYFKEKHKGVCATRNSLLKKATSEYVMFCDADDMFFNALGISSIFEGIKSNPDVFVSNFIESTQKKDFNFIKEHPIDRFFLHGKVFKREYLIKNNIKWNNKFLHSGDAYFLGLTLNLTDNIVYSSFAFYLWKYNENSICRRNKNHYIDNFGIKLEVDYELFEELLRRGKKEIAEKIIIDIIYESYCVMNNPKWGEQLQKNKIAVESRLKEYILKYKNFYEHVSNNNINIILFEKKYHPLLVKEISKESVDSWIAKILNGDSLTSIKNSAIINA